jgi:hypothetical protein
MEFLLYLHANKVRKNSVFVSLIYPRNTSRENCGIPIGQKENIAVFFNNTFFIPLVTRNFFKFFVKSFIIIFSFLFTLFSSGLPVYQQNFYDGLMGLSI